MTADAHTRICDAPLAEDLVFTRDMQLYGCTQTRLWCPRGHSVYVGVPDPKAKRVVVTPDSRCCSVCGEPGVASDRRTHPECRRTPSKPVRLRICPDCSAPLPSYASANRIFCDDCRETRQSGAEYRAKARRRERERLLALVSS